MRAFLLPAPETGSAPGSVFKRCCKLLFLVGLAENAAAELRGRPTGKAMTYAAYPGPSAIHCLFVESARLLPKHRRRPRRLIFDNV